jgi:hypothetical protein
MKNYIYNLLNFTATYKMTLPKFDNYKEEGPCDNGYETIQDFFLSWTLRCSPTNYKEADTKVQEYARRIVYALIFGHNRTESYSIDGQIPDTFQVIHVTTKRQLSSIDLLAEVTTKEKGVEKKYVLNIENKWYSGLRQGQLNKYNKFIQNNFPGTENVNLFITCDDCRKNYDWEKEECRLNNYKYLTIENLFSITKMSDDGRTGNALFDEYWFG